MTHYDTDIIEYNSVIIVTWFADGSHLQEAHDCQDVLVVTGNRGILFEKQNVFARSAIIEVRPYKTMW